MQVSVHLTFDNQCRAAFERYCELFGGEIVNITRFSETPDGENVPDDWQDAVIHGSMKIGDSVIAGADIPPERFQKSQGFFMFVDIPEPKEAERIFAALAEGGDVQMPMQETFWAKRFGVVNDRFGTPWEVNCSQNS
jgi:PhnB protein